MQERKSSFRLNRYHLFKFSILIIFLSVTLLLTFIFYSKIHIRENLKNKSISFNKQISLNTIYLHSVQAIDSIWFFLPDRQDGFLIGDQAVIFNHNYQAIYVSFRSQSNNSLIDSLGFQLERIFNQTSRTDHNEPYYFRALISGQADVIGYVIYNQLLNNYIVIFRSISTLRVFLLHFVLYTIFLLLIIILLGSVFIISINRKIYIPLSLFVKSIIQEGNLEINKPLSGDVFYFLRKKYEQLQHQKKNLEEIIEKNAEKNIKLENDLKLAKKLQRNLMPSITPTLKNRKEFDMFAISESAFDIGGDLYDYFLMDDDRLLLAVADVAGKGIPASLYMIYTHTLLRNISKPELSVAEIIEKLNNKLIDENISDMFVTFFLGILNIRTGVFDYCNAAHNIPLVIHSEGRIEELHEMHGIPIGIYPNRKYTSSRISLSMGDQIFIYSDGLTDATDDSGMKFSLDVLKYNLMGTWFEKPRDIVLKIRHNINLFRKGKNPEDDMTILIVQYLPNG